jgi:hypothetical protein
MAIAAAVNLGLVLFDLSYVPWRDFYLRNFPALNRLNIPGFTLIPSLPYGYDSIKGIEPHRETQNYLLTVNALKQQVTKTGLQSPQSKVLLEELRRLSVEMIDTNPFELANKTGTLEKIKNRMRDRLGKKSAREALTLFWSQGHLSNGRYQQEMDFFTQKIQPLIATNYYRNIGENGEFIDNFWLLDLPFVALFGLEFLARTFYISRRHVGIRWIDAMLWRWYDIFLLLPVWRWLRVIPVIIRLNQSQLLNLERVRRQINEGFVANFASELTEVVLIQLINQIQVSVGQGELTRWLFQSKSRQYIDINNINEVEAIASLLVNLTVYQVLPQIQPDIVAILRHNIESVLNQSPLYRSVQNLPGLANVPQELSLQLAQSIAQNLYNAIVAAVEDPEGAKIFTQLQQHFSEALGSQVQKKQTLERIQALLCDFLEEVKLNYVKRLEGEDVEQIMEQTRHLRQQALK